MTVKQDGGAGSSTSMLGKDQPEPVEFADLISSFQDKERSSGRGLPKNLTSSFPVAVQSGGPAPSAPFASLTSSFLATEGSGGPDPIMDPTPFLGTELDSKPYQISPCVTTTLSLIQPEQSIPSASWKQPEKEHFSSSETTGLRSPDAVMEENNKSLWKPATVGKLAIRLARQAYFGDSVLMASTVTKNGKPALDNKKLNLLYGNIHNNVFKSTSADYFNKHIVPIINRAI